MTLVPHHYANKFPVGTPSGSSPEKIREGELKIARAMASTSFGRRHHTRAESVYFIQSGNDGPIKIGSATHPLSRLRDLQTGNPFHLRLLGSEPGGPNRELTLHRQFRSDRIRGEWFRPSIAILDYIEGIAK